MDFLTDNPDLSTPEGARKAIHDVHKAAKELRDDNGKLRADIVSMSTDLKAAQQTLTETRASLEAAPRGDSEMGRYIDQKGLRLTGREVKGVYLPGILDDSKDRSDWQGEFKSACEDYNLVSTALGGKHAAKSIARIQHIIRQAPSDIRKAFDSQAGSGGEFIPAPVLPLLEHDVVVRADVMGLFQEIPVSSNSQTLPVVGARSRPYLKGTVTSDTPAQFTASSMSTAERTISPKGLAIRVVVDDDAAEDSIIDALPLIREDMVSSLAYGIDDAIINGDTAGSPADTYASWDTRGLWGSDDGGSIDHRKAWVGLRARANDVSATADRSTYSFANTLGDFAPLAAPRGLGGTVGELIYLISPEGYLANVAGIDQVSTVDRYGPKASVLMGEIARLGGARIVLTDFMTADLNASGNYDGTTTTKTGALCLNRARHKMFTRRGRTVELQRDSTRGITHIIVTWRGQFKPIASATTKDVVFQFNLATS